MNPATAPGCPQLNPANPASLYVGDLHYEVTEAALFEKFSSQGPVLSIRVCRDVLSRRSLGYAYVNFQNAQDASRALEELNFEPICKIPMRIMWSQRDPALRRSGVGNIFIKNLDKTIDNKALYDTFSAFGTILSCKVAMDEKGHSKGHGFVHFETEEAAQGAISTVNGMLLNDRKVYVGRFMTRRERIETNGAAPQYFTNIYVKNLPDEIDSDEKLAEMFESLGEIGSAKLMLDSNGKSRHFGFCNFESSEDAQNACQEMNNKVLENGKVLYVGRAQKKYEREAELRTRFAKVNEDREKSYQGVNLYIKNLADFVDDERLREEFSVYGTITSAKVMRDDKEHSKGFGFVCFSSPEEATKAVTEMNGSLLGTKPLYVALAQRKEERKIHLSRHYIHQHQMRMQPGQVPLFQPHLYMQFPPAGQHPPAFITQPTGVRPQHGRYPQAGARHKNMIPGGVYGNMHGHPAGIARSRHLTNSRSAPGQSQAAAGQQAAVSRSAAARGGGVATASKGRGPVAGHSAAAAADVSTAAAPASAAQSPAAAADAEPAQAASADTQGSLPLDLHALSGATLAEQKQLLGEFLFPRIQEEHLDQAGKITGMLLEIDNAEIIHMLESKQSLKDKIAEAVEVLQKHQQPASEE